MGAPRNLDEVGVFLKNMFKDKNIITTKSDFLRSMIAFFITTTRLKEAKNNYKKIGSISPLVAKTDELLEVVSKEFPKDVVVNIMRYTPRFSKDVIAVLKEKEIQEVVLLPLYPHYSTTTVKSSLEDFYESAKELDFNPTIKEIKPYFEDPLYNNSIIQTIKDVLKDADPQKIDLIFSAHSLPKKIVEKGDSYQDEIEEHVRILTALLKENGLDFSEFHLAYQSKLGPLPWLEPNLRDKLHELKGRLVLVVPISFTLDNSETDFELSIEYKDEAKELGIVDYKVAKCPNNLSIDFIKKAINDS
jgi:ferrochelatase